MDYKSDSYQEEGKKIPLKKRVVRNISTSNYQYDSFGSNSTIFFDIVVMKSTQIVYEKLVNFNSFKQ